MINAGDYFERKRAELGLDRGNSLTQMQAVLDKWYPGQTRAKSLNHSVLQIVTPSSVIASELRMRQVELLAIVDVIAPVTRLQLSIENLN